MAVTSVFEDRVYAYKWMKTLQKDIAKFINTFSFKVGQFENHLQPAQEWDSLITADMHEVVEKLGEILATLNTWYDGEADGIIQSESEESILKEIYGKQK